MFGGAARFLTISDGAARPIVCLRARCRAGKGAQARANPFECEARERCYRRTKKQQAKMMMRSLVPFYTLSSNHSGDEGAFASLV